MVAFMNIMGPYQKHVQNPLTLKYDMIQMLVLLYGEAQSKAYVLGVNV
jgi:hypothetical protein